MFIYIYEHTVVDLPSRPDDFGFESHSYTLSSLAAHISLRIFMSQSLEKIFL